MARSIGVWRRVDGRLTTYVVMFAAAVSIAATYASRRRSAAAAGVLVAVENTVVWKGETTGDPNNARASARFQLMNKGGRAVRILDVESGCGCAKPSAEPKVVGPGSSSVVSVFALVAPFTTRDVPITVRTDSPGSAAVKLTLRIVGNHKPPYLFQAAGSLTFSGADSLGETRNVSVQTIETEAKGAVPEVTTDLPFLKIEGAGGSEQRQGPDVVIRNRFYKVGFAAKPPSGTVTGKVTVKDPWNPGNVKELNVLIQSRSPLKATPSVVRLGPPGANEATVLIIADRAGAGLTVEVEGDARSAITAEREPMGPSARFHKIKLRRNGPPEGPSGKANLRIRAEGVDEPLVVPITLSAR